VTKLLIAVHPEDHLQGNPAAPCTLVEYGDYQCPSCGLAYPMVKKLQRHFGKRLALVFRNFPLTQIHPWAEPAAEVAEFAARYDKFWQMHDQLFENQSRLSNALFLELAENLDLSPTELQAAVAGRIYREQVRQEVSGGIRSGVNGTPTFFINGQRHNGPHDFDTLSRVIEEVI
jgi:protein-disulfide isomerase